MAKNMVAGAISFRSAVVWIFFVPSLSWIYGMIRLLLSSMLSTEKFLTRVITLAHSTIAKMKIRNPKNVPKIYAVLDLFLTVINL